MDILNDDVIKFAEAFPVPIFKVDSEGKIFYVNKSASSKLGYKKSEILKKSVYDFFLSKDYATLKNRLQNNASNRKSYNSYEYTIYRKNGGSFPAIIYSKIISENSKQFVIGCFFDITERKKSEESIKESREEIRSLNRFNQGIIDGISDELIVMDAKTRNIEYANSKVVQRTGMSLGELTKRKCFEIYHPNDTSSYCQAFEVMRTGVKREYEKRIYDPARKINSDLSITVHPLMDEKGHVDKLIHITRDITNKKTYEKRLAELNDRLLSLYKTSSSLQKAISTDKIVDIALKTFESLGFDRVRVYRYSDNKLYGIKSNHVDSEEFQKIEFPLHKRFRKAYKCIDEKKPVIERTSGRKKIASFLEKPAGLKSGSLPLISENKVFGMISFDNKITGKEIIEKDLELLMTFANQIASAMQRSEFVAENEDKLSRLSTLYDIYSTISQTLDMEKIMNMVVIRLVKLLRLDRCSIFLQDGNKKELVRLAVFDKRNIDPAINKKIPLDDSISSRVVRLNRPIFVEDVQKSRFYNDKKGAREKSLHSYLGVPLSIENKAIGVINCHTRSARNFSNSDIELLKALSSTASMMIENSRLYERIKYDKDNFSELLNVTQNIGKIHDIDSLVKEVLNESVSFTEADHGFVMLLDNDNLELTFSTGSPIAGSDKMSFKIGKGVVGMVAKTGKPYVIDDVREDENYVKLDDKVKSSATIPLLKKGSVMGVLHLESSRLEKFKYYSKSLSILTNHIAVTIENIRLYNQVLNFNKELESRIDEATKELQEKNRELKKMDEMKSDFVSNVSHELRTPLTSIIGYTKLLSQGKLGELNGQQSHVIGVIVSESERLSRLINDVLDLSKLESGKLNVHFEGVDVAQEIKDSLESLKHIAESKDIKLSTKLKNDLVIDSSPDLLKQMIINLANNGIKFTKKGGKVTVTTESNDGKVTIKVRDTGVGIAKEVIPKLFDKFYQVDSSMTREYSGTGLGLVIVKHIVDLHGGKIDVKSKPGKGSSFIVELPQRQLE